MTDKPITCSYCGYTFIPRTDTEDSPPQCPACGKRLFPRDEAPQNATDAAIGLQESDDVLHQRLCPACGAELHARNTSCPWCGYDLKNTPSVTTGETAVSSRFRWVFALLLGITVAVLGVAAYQLLVQQGAEFTPSTEIEIDESFTPTEAQTNEMAGFETDIVMEEEVEATFTKQELAEMEKLFRKKLAIELNKRYPLFERDSEIKLYKKNGQVLRGRFLGVKYGVVVLSRDKESQETKVEELDKISRVRVDKKYRQQIIDYQVNKRMQKVTQL
jgi:DNA-directed RNA polymerase subunit RPC12/RpoP